MFIIAQFFGILDMITNIIAMQMKKKDQIIFLVIFSNLFASINFILLHSYTGPVMCIFAIIQILINKIFEKKEQQVPKIVILTYIVISIISGLISFNKFVDILPVICSTLFSITIIQDKEKNIRKISLINIILWVIYDVVCLAFTAALSDLLTTISTLIGMYRLDYKKAKNNG